MKLWESEATGCRWNPKQPTQTCVASLTIGEPTDSRQGSSKIGAKTTNSNTNYRNGLKLHAFGKKLRLIGTRQARDTE